MVDHISLMEKNNNTLNLNDVSRKETLRKCIIVSYFLESGFIHSFPILDSSPISIDSPLALSVLEEKLNELNGKTESLKHRSTAQPAPINVIIFRKIFGIILEVAVLVKFLVGW